MSIPKPKTILETAKNAKLAFVGARVMGPAMAKALLDKSIVNAENITLCNLNKEITENLSKDFPNSVVTQNPSEAVDGVDVVILCVPPTEYESVLVAIRPILNKKQIVMSVLAGVPVRLLQPLIPNIPLVRVMPNITAVVGEMASGYAFSGSVKDDLHKDLSVHLLSSIGSTFNVKEELLDAVTGVSGSSPAFALMLIESLADGGLLHGLPKHVGLKLAARAVMGAAKMVLETGQHPSMIRDRITSPGGTTIAGIQSLEDDGYRAAIINAVDRVVEKAGELYSDKEDEEEE